MKKDGLENAVRRALARLRGHFALVLITADDPEKIVEAVGGFLKGKKLPLGDGVDGDDRALLRSFPYEADPGSGFANDKGGQKGN
jgi:hypothetical protein